MRGRVLKLKSEEIQEEQKRNTAVLLEKEGDSIEKIARVLNETEETIMEWLGITEEEVLKQKAEKFIRESELKKTREIALNFAKMGLPVERIAQGVNVNEETIREWLAEKQN